MRVLTGVFVGCALSFATQAATFVNLQSQPGDPTLGGAQRVEYDLHLEADQTVKYVMTVTPNEAGGVDFLRALPCIPGQLCASNNDFTHIQFAPAAGQTFGVGTYSQAQRYSKTPGSNPGFFADEQGRDVAACATITGSYVVRELVRAADGTVQRFAADFEQHCKGQPDALYGAVRFNSDVPYVRPVGFAIGSVRYASGATDPIGMGAADAFIVLDGHTATNGSTRNAVHLELQSSDGTPVWVLDFAAPNNDPLQPGGYGSAVFPRTSPSQPSLTVSNAGHTCAANTASFRIFDIAWSSTNGLERFAADITVTCNGVSDSLDAGVRYNSTQPYIAVNSTHAMIDLPEGPVTISVDGTTKDCGMGTTAVFYPAATLSMGLPKYIATPYAAFDFLAQNCVPSSAVRFSVEYPNPLPPTAQWWKFGPTLLDNVAHWYVVPSTVDGNRITFTIIDGDLGDDDLRTNGTVHDLGVLGIPGGMFQDLWWSGSAENGWGLTIAQHRDVLFGNLFVYDAQGAPTWYVMPSGSWNAAHTAYTGNLYLPSGSPFFAYDASRFNVGAAVGTAKLTFADANNATLDYSINGVTGHKDITRLEFGPNSPPTDQPLADLWWGGSAQNGWGIALMEQYNSLFGLWFTYDANGKATWFVMPSGDWAARNDYQGKIYRAAGPPWVGVPYDASRHRLTEVGTFRYRFGGDAAAATFDFSVDGKAGSINLGRVPF